MTCRFVGAEAGSFVPQKVPPRHLTCCTHSVLIAPAVMAVVADGPASAAASLCGAVASGCGTFWLRPPQVPKAAHGCVRALGRLGWLSKAFVYACLGGLLCRGAVSDDVKRESPQAVFVLVGSFPVGNVWLSALALGVAVYALWRFVEGLLGQGYSPDASAASNIFRYRVSPLTSGGVYVAYLVFLCEVLLDVDDGDGEKGDQSETIPSPGLCALLAVAFLAATLSQLVQTLRPHAQFCQELDPAVVAAHPSAAAVVKVMGRVGFAGRATLFMLVSVLFWKALSGTLSDDESASTGSNMARALRSLHGSGAGRAFLFVLGIALLDYAMFATANVWMRSFPTVAVRSRRASGVSASGGAGGGVTGEMTPLRGGGGAAAAAAAASPTAPQYTAPPLPSPTDVV